MRPHILGDLTSDEFLQHYWQKKPLLIRNAMPIDAPPISAEELAGLACEVEDAGRIVQEHHRDTPWKVSYGPFEDEDFTSLPDSHWTLLVTDCEKHLPELRSLVEPFRFIPDWRIDDLMISYAADNGSVGPHVDQYDVFLLQLEGQREWRVGDIASEEDCIPGLELNILREFSANDSWLVSPGDLLYLPPGLSHYGIAKGPCMTASIGFRAPSHRDIMQAWIDDKVLQIPNDLRLTDAQVSSAADPSEITASTAEHFQSILNQHLQQSAHQFKDWLGNYLTETGPYQIGADRSISKAEFIRQLRSPDKSIFHTPYSRFSWQKDDAEIILSANGKSSRLAATLQSDISLLCQQDITPTNQLVNLDNPQWQEALFQLYSNGAIDLTNTTELQQQ